MSIEVGTYISEELSEYINHWVDGSDMKAIAKEHDMSSELGRALVMRDRKVTENNLKVITDILERAICNRNKTLPVLEKIHEHIIEDFKHELKV